MQSTSQVNLSTTQIQKSTTQTSYCADTGETCSPVATGTCVPGGGFHCETVATGPTLVASCTAAPAGPTNNYVQTTCDVTATGPTPVLSCTPAAATAANSYIATTCNTVTTAGVPVNGCNPAPAVAANAYTATTCTPVSYPPQRKSAEVTPTYASWDGMLEMTPSRYGEPGG